MTAQPKVYHKSQSGLWETPPALFERLYAEFRFDIDAAASSANARCPVYFDEAADGLRQLWSPFTVWCNPPYAQAARWLRKGALESRRGGATAVMLVAARTGTEYWREWVWQEAHEIRFLIGRVKFLVDGKPIGSETGWGAPFDSALVIYRPGLPPAGGPRVAPWDWTKELDPAYGEPPVQWG